MIQEQPHSKKYTVLESNKSSDRNRSFWQADREQGLNELESMAGILEMFIFGFVFFPVPSVVVIII